MRGGEKNDAYRKIHVSVVHRYDILSRRQSNVGHLVCVFFCLYVGVSFGMTHSHKTHLTLFKTLAGKTQIKAPVIQENDVKMFGYQPSKVREFRRW